jgi:hypothetical protein
LQPASLSLTKLVLPHQPITKNKMKGKAMRMMRRMGLIFGVAGILALLCGSSCKGKLEPGGAYSPVTTNADGTLNFTQAPDIGLFVADSGFDLAYSGMETAFKIERDNRALLWKVSPQIKHTLDQIRPKAVDGKLKYAQARAAYIANPVPANLDALNTILAEVKALTAAATAVLPQNGNQPGKLNR